MSRRRKPTSRRPARPDEFMMAGAVDPYVWIANVVEVAEREGLSAATTKSNVLAAAFIAADARADGTIRIGPKENARMERFLDLLDSVGFFASAIEV